MSAMRGPGAREARLRLWAAVGRWPNPGAAMPCRLRGAAVMRGAGQLFQPGVELDEGRAQREQPGARLMPDLYHRDPSEEGDGFNCPDNCRH